MIEFVLVGVIVVLSLLLAWKEHIAKQERDKYINALISKNATELRDIELVSKIVKVKPEVNVESKQEFMPESDVPTEDLLDMAAKGDTSG